MFEAVQTGVDKCPNGLRIKKLLIFNKKWRPSEKSKWLLTRGREPRTWFNLAVILLSMLNVVFAEFASEIVDDGWDANDESGHYSRQWAVSIEGGQEVADRIAAKHEFINLGKIFGNFYHFEHKRLAKRSSAPHADFHRNLVNEAEVKWAQQQIFKKRSKRDLITPRPRSKSGYTKFNDEEWPNMWYLNRGQGLDMNVQGAWQEGITGNGVVVTILDDGLEKDHPDLRANYDSQASYDVNNHDEDPMPRYDYVDSNRHGTRCAGEVAAVANNTMCSVGVAFGASVGGVRMLDGDVTDAVEARSLSLNPQHIDIYSASWGPDDDGKTVDGPGELATRAFIEGVTKGRQGKGSIFVWASGNGGREHDNCNCDGYTNSIWTLSISSATEKGLVPWYSEACSSTLATTYSSGALNEKQIVTTDLRHQCTSGHTGTSASAPLAAGICALALEANRDLTWRDMQHIVVRTARPGNLQSLDWKVNGVGRKVSHSFGYGLMDATAMVKLARTWKTVPEQHRCEVSAPHVNKPIPPRSKVILKLNVTECAGVNYLEHVQAKISLSSAQRGGLQIYLTSPAGTKATLLAKRPRDTSRIPFTAWPFMSVHTWGEMPFGVWQLEIHYDGHFMGRAILQEWSLLFYGTLETPAGDTNGKFSEPLKYIKSGYAKPNANNSNSNSNSKSHKPGIGSYGNPNRKNFKSWRGKPASSRMGKVLGIGGNSELARISFTDAAAKNVKQNLKSTHPSQTQELNSKRTFSKATWAPVSTHGLPLTIVLGPDSDFTVHQKVPDVFQKYQKIEQLFPLYVNSNRPYSEENIVISKIDSASPSFSKSSSKSKFFSTNGQKTERQNRFDTAFMEKKNGDKKVNGNKKSTALGNRQTEGDFEGWQMLFYGTEVTPNEEKDLISKETQGHNRKSEKEKTAGSVEGRLGERPGDAASGRRPKLTSSKGTWTDGKEGLGKPSSGCVSLSKSTYSCLECISGMHLHEGRCVAECPVQTYAGKSKGMATICRSCHYTCLTCAGESDGHCTSCHEGDSPVRSGLVVSEFPSTSSESSKNFAKSSFDDDDDDDDDDVPRWSWGKRESESTKGNANLNATPDSLYYCYSAKLIDRIENSEPWYYRKTILFPFNLFLLLVILTIVVLKKCFHGNEKNENLVDNMSWKYVKISNGESEITLNKRDERINPPDGSDEEEEFLMDKKSLIVN